MKYRYTPKHEQTPGAIPPAGATGEAYPARGCYDPAETEYGAWLFAPDEPYRSSVDPPGVAYYVAANELEEVE